MAVLVFELEEVVASGFRDGVCLWLIVVECVAGDRRAFEFGLFVEFEGDGLFALALVLIGL